VTRGKHACNPFGRRRALVDQGLRDRNSLRGATADEREHVDGDQI